MAHQLKFWYLIELFVWRLFALRGLIGSIFAIGLVGVAAEPATGIYLPEIITFAILLITTTVVIGELVRSVSGERAYQCYWSGVLKGIAISLLLAAIPIEGTLEAVMLVIDAAFWGSDFFVNIPSISECF